MTFARDATVFALPGIAQRNSGLIPAMQVTHPLIIEWEMWHVAARKSPNTTSERIRVINHQTVGES